MPEIHRIRKLREKKGLSIAEISRETGYNWRTVKKYADGDISVQPTVKRKKGMMEEGYGQIIDDWLEEDAKLPRKRRRTNKTMFEALCRDHGFQGFYRTVCAYVQKRGPQFKLEKEQRYERLEHPLGEAQVDFGKMTVMTKEGKEEERSVLIICFPYSNAAYAYSLPAENSECFLHGLTQLFRQAGGYRLRHALSAVQSPLLTWLNDKFMEQASLCIFSCNSLHFLLAKNTLTNVFAVLYIY